MSPKIKTKEVKTFEKFMETLKNYELKTFSKFNVYQNTKGFLGEKRKISQGMKLHWKNGLPYFHFGSRVYTCHHGKDKNRAKKQKYAENKPETVKKYNLIQPSKKLDCPASITITRAYTLPQFKLKIPTKSKKNVVSAKIKRKLKNNEHVEGEEVFWFTLPSVNAHKNHMLEDISTVSEPVDPAVHSKIKELVREGKRDASVISELLEKFVRTDSKQNNKKRKYSFPDIPTIEEIIKEGNNWGKRRKLINQCHSQIRNLASILWTLPERALLELNEELLDLAERMQHKIIQENSSGIPLENNEYSRNHSLVPEDKVKENETSEASKDATENSIYCIFV